MEMNVALSTNLKYARYGAVMLSSLIETNDAHVNAFVMCTAGEEEKGVEEAFSFLKEKAEVRILPVKPDFLGTALPSNSDWTLETWYRLALVELLPGSIERVLYIDVDCVVLKDLSEFYGKELPDGVMMRVCRDATDNSAHLSNGQDRIFGDRVRADGTMDYFNAGVLVIDLRKMREKGMDLSFFAEKEREIEPVLVAFDQDLLNYTFPPAVVEYADYRRYDLFARSAFLNGADMKYIEDNVAILHFAGQKPWDPAAPRYILEKYFWDAAEKTPYFSEMLKELVYGEMHEGLTDAVGRDLERAKDANAELTAALGKYEEILKKLAGK